MMSDYAMFEDGGPDLMMVSRRAMTAVGAVVTHWSWVEIVLGQAVWERLDVEHTRGYCVTAHLSATQRWDLFEALLRTRSAMPPSFVAISVEFKRLQTIRNVVAHSPPGPSPDGRISARELVGLTKVTARGTLRFLDRTMSVAEIQQAALDIKALVLRLSDLVVELRMAPITGAGEASSH